MGGGGGGGGVGISLRYSNFCINAHTMGRDSKSYAVL